MVGLITTFNIVVMGAFVVFHVWSEKRAVRAIERDRHQAQIPLFVTVGPAICLRLVVLNGVAMAVFLLHVHAATVLEHPATPCAVFLLAWFFMRNAASQRLGQLCQDRFFGQQP